MVRLIPWHVKSLVTLTVGLSLITSLGIGLATAADVVAPSKANIYELTVRNIGVTDIKNAGIAFSITQNPFDLIQITGVTPPTADIPAGGKQIFEIRFDVDCPPEDTNEIKVAEFQFAIGKTTPGPLYVSQCGLDPHDCEGLKGRFSVWIAFSNCYKCENKELILKTAEEIGLCNQCVNGRIEPKLTKEDLCYRYECNPLDGSTKEVAKSPPFFARCIKWTCDKRAGFIPEYQMGCDHVDDNESPNPETQSKGLMPVFDSEAPISLLRSGFYTQAALLPGLIGEHVNGVPVDSVPTDIGKHPVLIIPSGGLYGMDNLAALKSSLEGYVEAGGTLIVFTQQHGYEYDIIPGKLAGYGWNEDESCQWKSMYVDTYHQILSSINKTTCDAGVDGYFTDWPEEATILLRRAKNDMPCMLLYPHGQGRVIATTMYEDWAMGNGQSTGDGRRIVRDMLRWAQKPADLPEFSPGNPIALSSGLTNQVAEPSTFAEITILNPDSQIIRTEILEKHIEPGQTDTVAFSVENIPGDLGIWTVKAVLLNGDHIPIQAEAPADRFVVSDPPQSIKIKEISFSVNSKAEEYLIGTEAEFTVTVWNHGVTERRITVCSNFMHHFWESGHNQIYDTQAFILIVPPGGMQAHSIKVPVFTMDNCWLHFYDENRKLIGAANRGFDVAQNQINQLLMLKTDKTSYISGETVVLTADYIGLHDWHTITDLRVTVTDPQGQTIFHESRPINLSATMDQEVFEFPVGIPAKAGIYKVKAALYNFDNNLVAQQAEAIFDVPKYQLSITPVVPNALQPGVSSVAFNIDNTTSGGVISDSAGQFIVSLIGPNRSLVWTEQKIVDLHEGQHFNFDFPLVSDEFIKFGEYYYAYSLYFEGSHFQTSKTILCLATLKGGLDRQEYRAGEILSLDVTAASIGRIILKDMNLNLSIPEFAVDENRTVSLIPGQSSNTSFSVTIPESASPGLHFAVVTLSKNGSTQQASYWFHVPPSKIHLNFTGNNYHVGEAISVDLLNSGGANSDTEYALALLDVFEQEIHGVNGTLSLPIDQTRQISMVVPASANSGIYQVKAQVNDTATGEYREYFHSIIVANENTAEVALQVQTDQEIYFQADPKTISADLYLLQGSLENGNLKLEIDSVEKIWTSQEDWQTGLLNLVDIDSQPGDVLPAIPEGSEGDRTGTYAPDGRLKWTFDSGCLSESTPVLGSDGTIYANLRTLGEVSYGVLYAVRSDGSPGWTFQTKESSYYSPVIGNDGAVYISVDYTLFAVKEGEELWRFNSNGGCFLAPAVGMDGTVYAVTTTGTIIALYPDGVEKWRYEQAGYMYFPPVVGADGNLYLAIDKDDIYYIQAIHPNGTEAWLYDAGAWFRSSPEVDSGGTIYIWTKDNSLNAINPDGFLKWKYTAGEYTGGGPSFGPDGKIYFSAGDQITALTPDGSEIWRSWVNGSVMDRPVLGADSTLYFTANGYYWGYDYSVIGALNQDGTLHWTYRIPGQVEGGVVLSGYGEALAVGRNGLFYSVGGQGRSITLKVDAGHSLAWGQIKLFAEEAWESRIQVSTRTAENETELVDSFWTSYPPSGQIGSAAFAADIASKPGRWLEIELNFENAYRWGDQVGDCFPIVHALMVSSETGSVVWSQDLPITLAGSSHLDVPLETQLPEGRYVLKGILTNSLSQQVGMDNHVFYINDDYIRLTFDTDKQLYRPGDAVQVSGRVVNTLSEPASGRSLSFQIKGMVIYDQIIDLAGLGEYPFTFSFIAPESTSVLTGTLDTRQIPVSVVVGKPALAVNLSPSQAGRETFDLAMTLANSGNMEAKVNAAVAGSTYPLSIPAGQSRVLTIPYSITADTTLPVVISGDVDQTFQHHIAFCEQVAVSVSPAAFYGEGLVEIPYQVKNTGCSSSKTDIVFNLNGQLVTKPVVVPAGGTLSDSLTFSIGSGEYSLSHQSVFGSGSVPVKVLGTDQLEMLVDVGYPHPSKVLLLTDSSAQTDVEGALLKDGMAMDVDRVLVSEWDGTHPDLKAYEVVVLTDSSRNGTILPVLGRAALKEFVDQGGGLVILEQVLAENTGNSGLADLFLFDPAGYETVQGEDTLAVVPDHPITVGITAPIHLPLISGNAGALRPDAAAVVTGTLLPNAVAVKAMGLGRIVQFAAADSTMPGVFSTNPAMHTLLGNAVHWSARRAAPGKINAAVLVRNAGSNDFIGDLAITTDFSELVENLTLAVGQSRVVQFELDTTNLSPGVYPLSARVSKIGLPVQQIRKDIEVSGPRFEPEDLPLLPSYAAGAQGSMTFTVRNVGMTGGPAEVRFTFLDVLYELRHVWLEPGEGKTLTYNFMLPDDLSAHDFMATLFLEGQAFDIPFRLNGVSMEALATLDQPVYNIGDTAELTLEVVNHSSLHPDMIARVVADFENYEQSFTLGDSAALKFYIPITATTPEQFTYGVYMAAGRSVYLNTIPVRLRDPFITLCPDKAAYLPGETVTMQVLTAETGDLAVSAPGFNEILLVAGDTTFSFVLPTEMMSDRYPVEYQLGEHTGVCPIYVNGLNARVLEAGLNKPLYEPQDNLNLALVVDVSQSMDVLLKGWVYRPGAEFQPLFETGCALPVGESRVTIDPVEFSVTQAGVYYLIYTLYKADTLLEVFTAAEAFEVQSAAITGLHLEQSVYGVTEAVSIQVDTFACTPVAGRITLLLNGGVAVEQDENLTGAGTILFDLGLLPMGKYDLTARLTAGQLVSQKSAAFSVTDQAAPAKPTGLAADTIGNVTTLTWNPNPESDLLGYHVYRNGVRLNAVALTGAAFADEGYFVEAAQEYRITAMDRAGNESPPSETATVLRDGTPPSITLSPAVETYAQQAVTVTYTVTDSHDPDPLVTASHPSPTMLYRSGDYLVRVQAQDAAGNIAERSVQIHISIPGDTDGDGMADAWELQYFGTLTRDGSGDHDGDGLTDLAEYQSGTDPVSSNAPPMPQVMYPLVGGEVTDRNPELAIENSTDPNGDAVFYTFEVYADEQMTELVARQADLPQADSYTAWTVPPALSDNTWYHWRVRAGDGICFSSWVYGRFFVNTANDPPAEFLVSRPMDQTEVSTRTPVLEVGNSLDPDHDVLSYRFEIYADAEMTVLAAASAGIPAGDNGVTAWMVDTLLNDNAWYYWQVAVADEHGAETRTVLSAFFVNTANDAPPAPTIAAPADGAESASSDLNLVINNALDADGDALVYRFALDTVNTFDGPDLLVSEDIPAVGATTAWHVTGLDDNTLYHWRVKAFDGLAESPWVTGRFFVNTANDAPGIPALKNPGLGAWVDTLTPGLELQAVQDPDSDSLIYRFEVYADPGLTMLVAAGQADVPQWVVENSLNDNHWYYWRARAVDEHGAASAWTETFRFFTDENGVDDPPAVTIITPAADQRTNTDTFLIRWEDSDPDSNAGMALYYDTDATGADGLPIVQGLLEDGEGSDDTWLWGTGGLADGIYYVYAVISDGNAPAAISYSPGALIIDRTAPMVIAVPAGGIYESAQLVTLAADEAGTIYYTLDGSQPSTSAIPYAAPIELSEDTVLKFLAVDAAGNSSAVGLEQYTIRIPNLLPLAEAGENRTIYLGETVNLDGSGSTDPDNGPMPLTYRWYFTGLPAGSTLTDADISTYNSVQAAFVPDVIGAYGVALEVSDGKDRATDSITVNVALNDGFDIRTIALFAGEQIHLEPGARVNSGHVVVLDQDQWGLRELFKRELIVGNGAYTADGTVLFGDTVHIKPGASVNEVHYNELRNKGTIRGAAVTPLSLPPDLVLPDFITPSPGTAKIEVQAGQERILAPGAYGDVLLKAQSRLVFTGGVYHLQSLDVGNDNCRVLFTAPTDLMIAGGIGPGQGAYIGPSAGSGIGAKDIRIYVQGKKKWGEPMLMAVMIGNHNTLKANIYALNGRIWVKNNSTVEGALIGKQILIGIQTQVSLASGF